MFPSKRRVDSFSAATALPALVVDPFSGLQSANVSPKIVQSVCPPWIRFNLELVTLVVVWYMCAICTITTTKEIMNRFQFPFLLCFSQFSFASVLTYLYLKWSQRYKGVSIEARGVVVQIAVTYTLGFVFTNIAFSLGSAASVETIKSGEPLTTVLLGLVILRERYSRSTYVSLLPICGGVALACYNNEATNLMSFAMALASNVCFSARSVYTKVLNTLSTGSLDEINLFYAISWRGLLFLLPIMVILEGSSVLALVGKSSVSGDIVNIGSTEHAPTSIWAVALLLTINGGTFAAYNLTSYAVLKKTELVTHSVLNVFRRVFIIAFTSLYFHVQLTGLSVTGIAVAILGVLFFSSCKRFDKGEAAK